MKIIGNIATFKINLIGESTQETMLGEFEVKCVLSALEEIEIDKEYRRLLGDNMLYASSKAKELAFALSQLKYRVISSPYFWQDLDNGEQCKDNNVIFEILNKSVEAQEQYLNERNKSVSQKKDKLTNMLKSGEIEEDIIQPEDLES